MDVYCLPCDRRINLRLSLRSLDYEVHSTFPFGNVIAMALTSQPQKAGYPLTHELDIENLPKKAWVKISQIRTLSTERLGKKIGRLNEDMLEKLIQGLTEIIA